MMGRLAAAVLALLLIGAALATATSQSSAAPAELTIVAAVKSHRTLYVTFSDDTTAALHPCATRTSRRCWWPPSRPGRTFVHLHGTTYRDFTIERTGS